MSLFFLFIFNVIYMPLIIVETSLENDNIILSGIIKIQAARYYILIYHSYRRKISFSIYIACGCMCVGSFSLQADS